MTAQRAPANIVIMTKHAAGKYGRTIGRKEQKALVAASNGVWCYVCEESHRWSSDLRRASREAPSRPSQLTHLSVLTPPSEPEGSLRTDRHGSREGSSRQRACRTMH